MDPMGLKVELPPLFEEAVDHQIGADKSLVWNQTDEEKRKEEATLQSEFYGAGGDDAAPEAKKLKVEINPRIIPAKFGAEKFDNLNEMGKNQNVENHFHPRNSASENRFGRQIKMEEL